MKIRSEIPAASPEDAQQEGDGEMLSVKYILKRNIKIIRKDIRSRQRKAAACHNVKFNAAQTAV